MNLIEELQKIYPAKRFYEWGGGVRCDYDGRTRLYVEDVLGKKSLDELKEFFIFEAER
jgi:hypothetical protein